MTTRAEKITEVETRLAKYIAAESAILGGAQSYSIGSRSLSRADLDQITKMITKLYAELNALNRGGQITSHRVLPRDI